MMTTGDKKNALKKLQSATKSIKYSSIDFKEISVGSPKEYLKLYHYLIIDYNPAIAIEILNKYQMELQGKNDKSFIDSIYKLMRDMLNYKPPITKEQFFSIGYAEIKALMACEIIHLIQQKFKLNLTAAKQPTPAQGKLSETNNKTVTVNRVAGLGIPTNRTPLVHNHRILNVNLPSNIKQSYSSDDIHKTLISNINTIKNTGSDENYLKKNTILEVLTNDDHDDNDDSDNNFDNESARSQKSSEQIKYENLLNEVNTLKELFKNSTLNSIDQRYSINGDEKFIKIPLKDYENLVSRVTLLENKIIIIEQQNQQLLNLVQDKNKLQFEQTTKRLSNNIDTNNTQLQKSSINNRVSNAAFKKTLSNNDLVIDDFDENNEETLYETPFVSFMNNSNDDINTTPNNKQYQPRASLVTKSLLTQGVLDESRESQNDLTPTIEAAKSTVNNDAIIRARTLEKKASALIEEMKNTVKITQ